MPDLNKIMQTIRRDAGLEVDIPHEPLIQIEADYDGTKHIPLIESAGETYERPISVCFAGVGTHGVNVVMSLKNQNLTNDLVEFVGINSDGSSMKELDKLGFKDNIWLSSADFNTHLGAGGKLEVGRELGEKYYEQFKKRFKSKELVLVVTGMGGGTGTGAAPLVAKAAKEVQQSKNNTLTIGVASLPSGEEYDKRKIAKIGIEELKKNVDALIVIDQLHLPEVLDQENASVDEGEEQVDSRFRIVLQSIMDTVTQYTKRNIDFADVCSTFKDCGDAIVTTVEVSSENMDEIKRALAKAINDKLLIDHSGKVASRLTIYHFFEPGYSVKNHGEVIREVKKLFNWVKTPDGFYKYPLEDTSNFEKVGTGMSEEYAGKTKVIIMAGGFVDKPPAKELPPALVHAAPATKSISAIPAIPAIPVSPTKTMPTPPPPQRPTLQATQIIQSPAEPDERNDIEKLLAKGKFTL
jgi:cell division protein FtsZ